MSDLVATTPLDLDAYFARIGYSGARAPTLAVLAEIQRRHVYSIPFENLDIHLGRPIRIDLPSITQKLIAGKRGGYCFEQNTLLRAALRALGFKVTSLIGRVRWLVPVDEETALTHMLLMVEIEGERWLADVGFGSGSLTAPLRIDTEEPQPTPHEPRRIIQREGVYIQQSNMPGEWTDVYHFTLRPAPDVDFQVGNWYTSTFPQSRFRLNLSIARADEGLRYSLLNREFTSRYKDGRVEKRQVSSPEELLGILSRYFHLEFPVGTRFEAPNAKWDC